jgi:branched-subunit amino acid transport protein
MTGAEWIFCILGLTLGAALPRILPMALPADRPMSPLVRLWLDFVPASVLAALAAPDILLRDGGLFLSPDNIFLLAAAPTLLVAWKTRSLAASLATGMALTALGRWWGL